MVKAMITEVFIGNVRSEKFDYDIEGNVNGYYPEVVGKSTFDSELFFDIMRENGSKRVDWGCSVLKLVKIEIINFLNREKYNKNDSAKNLLDIANALENDKEYLLVAFEDIISPPWD